MNDFPLMPDNITRYELSPDDGSSCKYSVIRVTGSGGYRWCIQEDFSGCVLWGSYYSVEEAIRAWQTMVRNKEGV